MEDKCFCHLNGKAVKDATARKDIAKLNEEFETHTAKEYTATPENFAEIIANANPGSVVTLSPGSYPTLYLVGNTYPENLTIIGGVGVSMSGVSITSGLTKQTGMTSNNPALKIPGNLVFDSITFTDNFRVRNCVMTGLQISNCTFNADKNIKINPDSLIDEYGRDDTSTSATVWHWPASKLHISNVLIKNNTFGVISAESNLTEAIMVACVDNIEIINNNIPGTPHHGIIITGQQGYYSTGRIAILGNTIKHTGASSIHIVSLKNAEVFVYSNMLFYANENGVGSTCITASSCQNTAFEWSYSSTSGKNVYCDASGNVAVEVGNGISLTNSVTATIESTEHNGCYYSTMNGETEWINPPMLSGKQYRTTERYNGKPVYKKLVYFGSFPQNSSRDVSTEIDSNKYKVVRAHRQANEIGVNAHIMFTANMTYEYIFVSNGKYYIHVTTNGQQEVTAYYIIDYVEV